VAQRGTSVTGLTSSSTYQTVDRYKVEISACGTFTVAQSSDAPDGFANSFQINCTTADASLDAGSLFIFSQRLEGQDLQRFKKGTSAAESMTVSFYIKAHQTGNFVLELVDEDNGPRQICALVSINSANTWEYKTVTFDGDTIGSFGDDNGSSLAINFWFVAGTTFSSGTLSTSWAARVDGNRAAGTDNFADTTGSINITGVQLEVGEQATPFEHRSFAEEWDRCQRYCTVYNVGGGNTHGQNLVSPNHTVPGAAGHVDVANRAEWFMSYPVKRSQPTITVTDPTNMRWIASGNVVQDATGSVTFPVGTGHQNANVFQSVASGIATSNVPEGWIYKGSGTNPVITIDAEL